MARWGSGELASRGQGENRERYEEVGRWGDGKARSGSILCSFY